MASDALAPDARGRASRALEEGGVLRLPRVTFVLDEAERRFLSPQWSDGRAKNISLDGARLKGARRHRRRIARRSRR